MQCYKISMTHFISPIGKINKILLATCDVHSVDGWMVGSWLLQLYRGGYFVEKHNSIHIIIFFVCLDREKLYAIFFKIGRKCGISKQMMKIATENRKILAKTPIALEDARGSAALSRRLV